MENREGALAFDVLIRDNNIDKLLAADEQRIKQFTDNVESNSQSIIGSFGNIGKAVGGIAIGASLKSWIGDIINVRGEFQQLEIAFTTMLGSGERATSLMQQITQTAVTTPFDLKGVANGAKQLLAYGESADTVNDTLVKLGNVASGLSIPLNDIVYLYGTTQVQGRLYAQDVRQFMGRGIPLVQELAKELGKTTDQINQMVTDGKIGFPEVQKVINNLTQSGGMFYNLMAEQSKSLTGQISNLSDAWDMMMNDIGKSNEGVLNSGIGIAATLVENYETVAETLGIIIGLYGTYKAAVITTAALQKASIHVAYEAETKLLAMLLPMKEEYANAEMKATLMKQGLTKAEAEQIMVLRAEAKAHLDVLKVEAEKAAFEVKRAKQSIIDARLVLYAKQQAIAVAKEELAVAVASGNAKRIESKQTQLDTLVNERNIAVRDLRAKKMAIETIQENAQAKAKAVNTMQTNLDTVSNVSNTASTNLLAVAKTKLITVVKKLYATLIAHPYTAILAAVAALGYGIYKLITYQTDAEKAQKRVNETNREYEKTVTSETTQINILFGRLKAAKDGTDAYQKAKDNIISKYGSYLQGLSNEIKALKDVEGAYKAISNAAIMAAKDRVLEKGTQEATDAYVDNWDKNIKKIKDRFNKQFGEEKGTLLLDSLKESLQNGEKISNEVQSALKEFDMEVQKGGYMGIGGYADTENRVMDYINDITKSKNILEKEIKDIESIFGKASKTDTKKDESTIIKSYNEQLKDAKDNVAKFKNELKDLYKGITPGDAPTDKTFNFVEAIENKKKELKEAQESLNTLSGYDPKSASKQENEKVKRLADYKKESDEYAKYVISKDKQAQLDIEQARIDAMKEGYDKELAQINQNYDKMIAENDSRQEEWIKRLKDKKQSEWLSENPDKKESSFSFSMTDEETAKMNDYLNKYKGIADNYKDKAKTDLIKKELEDYRTFSQKRIDIENEHQEKIKSIRAAGASEENVQVLEEKKKDALAALDEEMAQKEDVFKELIMQISYMSLSQLEEALQEAENALVQSIISNGENSKNTAVERAKIKKLQDEIKAVKAENKVKNSNELEVWNKTSNAIKNAKGEIDDMLGSMDFLDESTKEALQTASNVANGAIAMINGIKLLSMGAAAAISTVEKASVILTIISAAFQIISAIFSAASAAEKRHQQALDEIMKARIAQQREYNLLLLEQNLLYEKGNTILGNDSYGAAKNAVENYKETIEMLNKAIAGTEEQKNMLRLKNQFNMRFFGVSDPKQALKEMYAGLASISIVSGHEKTGLFGWGKGRDVYSNILDMYPKLIDTNGKFDAELAKTILSTQKMSDEAKESLQYMIDLSEQYEEAMEQVRDYLTDIFGELGSNMSDALVDAFKNGTDAAQAFVDSVSDMLERLAKEMIYSVTLAPLIEKAQNQMMITMDNTDLSDEQKFDAWAKTLQELMDGAISEQEKAKNLYKKYQEMAGNYGIDIFQKDEDEDDDTLEGNVKGVTEETASKLGGEITTMRIRQVEMLIVIQDISARQGEMLITSKDMSNKQVEMLIVIQDIKANTYNMHSTLRDSLVQLQTIAANTSYNKKLVDIASVIVEISNKLNANDLRAKGYNL
jgi:tape measure domain-containing protein